MKHASINLSIEFKGKGIKRVVDLTTPFNNLMEAIQYAKELSKTDNKLSIWLSTKYNDKYNCHIIIEDGTVVHRSMYLSYKYIAIFSDRKVITDVRKESKKVFYF